MTLADREAEQLITAQLKTIAPNIPVVGEEAVEAGHTTDISGGTFFLVDPLDGTREFIAGGADFSVNIGLLIDFKPVMGLIYAPVTDTLWFGAAGQAFSVLKGIEKKIAARQPPADGLTVATSRRHGDAERLTDFLKGRVIKNKLVRSSALKFCLIAEGTADLYPRLGPTSEWDTAAGEAILNAAGGRVTTLDGVPLRYGKAEKKFLNPEFIAFV